MEFTLEPAGERATLLAATTQCRATSRVAHRAFSVYWRVIRVGSGVIRLDMLRAIARRAEAGRARVS